VYLLDKVKATFTFHDWTINIGYAKIQSLGINAIPITVTKKEKTKKYLLIPMSYYFARNKKKQYEEIIESARTFGHVYDKYIFCDPFNFSDATLFNYNSMSSSNVWYAVLPISISEINSFRRIQKLIFELLVHTDDDGKICTYCGAAIVDGDNLCKKCMTVSETVSCTKCKNDFTAAYLSTKGSRKRKDETAYTRLPEFYKQERLQFFRNSVNMNNDIFLCPICAHENVRG
jgi:hypothetical protein